MEQLQRLFAIFLLGLWSAARWRQCYARADPEIWRLGDESRKITVADSDPLFVNLTLITPVPGAVCLDGSLPGYHLHPGFGSGASSWLVYLEGGGWCNNLRECVVRKTTRLGSSKFMEKKLQFSAILSNKPNENPDLYNWNKVYVRYCDGASFAGDGFNEERGLYFRGQRIWSAVMQELMGKGMSSAKQALLAGCSAGGLASILHCDEFRALFPVWTRVKCLADAGFFLDHADVSGGHFLKSFYEGVVTLQGVAQNLPLSCTSQMNATSCFFPQNIVANVQTPLFILNSAYDVWQIQESLAPDSVDPNGYWRDCKMNRLKCNSTQLLFLQEFRKAMIYALGGFSESEKNGLFINSCFTHCQSGVPETWHGDDSPAIGNKGIATSVGDWYFERSKVKAVDCAYPCDKSCHHLV